MLELKGIKKDYPAGGGVVHALKGIDLEFRASEFVSILGPSGCGKTTMLNIIGGLDRYTAGDLVINGRHTDNFKDRDWDTYRNHSVGFVFQSYNLIPHQSVLQNVELALTLSGVSKKERRKRAREALIRVGLEEQINKRPGEMSGGQMQRVAIARALVNNPDIILADEPTGALDTETSVQVMDILKEISRDHLVVMVTHNPDLAERYSTRIIRMLDGVITSDSSPLSDEERKLELKAGNEKAAREKNLKKPSMSFGMSFGLSLKNLFTKKGRTALTSFAGSIGIIGIALIYAVSQGMTTYINTVQEDTLSSYPITLESQHMDMSSLLTTFMGTAESAEKHELDAVYQKTMVYNLINSLNSAEAQENDLRSFKEHLENTLKDEESELANAVNGVQYTYDMDLQVYTQSSDGTIIRSDSSALMQDMLIEYFGMDLTGMMSMSETYGMPMSSGMSISTWQQLLSSKNGDPVSPLLHKQYDLIYGSWPNDYNEIVLVVDENNEVDDMSLYALGLKSKQEIDDLSYAALNKEEMNTDHRSWSYEEICNMKFRVVLGSDCYTEDKSTGTFTDLRETQTGLKYLYDNGIELRVTGIIRPSEDAVSSMLTGAIGYTYMLTEYVIEHAKESVAVERQMSDDSIDIFTGLPFKENTGKMTDEEKVEAFKSYIASLNMKGKAEAYIAIMSIPSDEDLQKAVAGAMMGKTRADMEAVVAQVIAAQTGMGEDEIAGYLAPMADEEISETYAMIVAEQVKMQMAQAVKQQLSQYDYTQLAMMLEGSMQTYTTEQFVKYHDEVLEFSDSTYESNMRELGVVDIDEPASINIYAASFEEKDVIEAAIEDYNKDVPELSQIAYTDYVGLMMSSITTIINAITYVLISFVAVSLIVSSIMIGVITLISVQERTKEIGILRALGASKRNVSGVFNAETVLIGGFAGAIGVGITYLLCIPINALLHYLTNIPNLSAYLPVPVAAMLIVISMLLTVVAGIIPSRSAAKKEPVVALRTE
ncbi:MAG: ABC transporter ATP-binding protein/permease [Clostridia bacterium]|nr:ABC transporter ATP-binding protein/permease [Clostridia bacterium]